MVLHTAVYDTVVNVIILYELWNGSASSDLVDYVQMVVMAIGLGYLGIDILPQGSVQQRPLQVMGCQGIACHQPMGVTVVNERLHGCPCIRVKGKRRSHDPDNIAVLLFML